MFGPALLVAPVYRYGARSREVYFPAAAKWYDFYTSLPVEAAGRQTVDAPYERIPLYVRGGSILPLGPGISSTAEVSDTPVTILVYTGADGSFNLYDDEGTNYNYENGASATIPLTYDDASSTLTIGDRRGSYPGMAATRRFNVVKIDGSAVDPLKALGKEVVYSGNELKIKL